MRLRALEALGHEEVDLSIVDAPTEAEKIKYSLSDNDRAGYYEEEKLAELVYPHAEEIKLDEYKVDLGTAVDLATVLQDFAPDFNPAELEDEEETEAERGRYINTCFTGEQIAKIMTKEILELDTTEIEKRLMSLSLIAYQFNRLCAGKRDGYWISIYHNPHRLYCPTEQHPASLTGIEKRDQALAKILARFIVIVSGRVCMPWEVIKFTPVGQAGYRTVNEFPPYMARDLVLEYTKGKEKISILDPCHGWGGRMVGALSTLKSVRYVGVDPAEATSRGVRQLADFLLQAEKLQALGSSVELICDGFETAEIPPGPYDFALTSPPYFDIEHYDNGEKQAWRKYKSAEEFNAIFLRTLIEKTMSHLTPDGVFVLNVSAEKYNMPGAVKSICKKLNLSCEPLDGYAIGGPGLGERAASDEYQGEPFFLIRRG